MTVQMNHGLEAVREVVGSAKETGIPDSAIREALWEYYFDVAQTIDWVYGTFKSPRLGPFLKGYV
jgi:hypothetical protein